MLRFCVCIIFQVVCLSKGRGLEWTPLKMKIIPASCSEFLFGVLQKKIAVLYR